MRWVAGCAGFAAPGSSDECECVCGGSVSQRRDCPFSATGARVELDESDVLIPHSRWYLRLLPEIRRNILGQGGRKMRLRSVSSFIIFPFALFIFFFLALGRAGLEKSSHPMGLRPHRLEEPLGQLWDC